MTDEIDKVRIYGDPVLRKISEEVTDFGEELLDIEERLIDSMFSHENGVGLSAPQIGILKRVIVIDESFGEDYDSILTMVNPEIIEADGSVSLKEGCLSVPEIFEMVERPQRIVVRYQDVDGEVDEFESDEFLARVVQHEVDHLDGILFIDRLSTVLKKPLEKQLKIIALESEVA